MGKQVTMNDDEEDVHNSTEIYDNPCDLTPPECTCILNGTIRCESRQLTHIPTIPKGAARVFLMNNSIQKVSVNDFQGMKRLTFLRVSTNRLSEIADGSFADTRLKVLHLKRNALTQISSGMFEGLSWLHWLDLSYNEISHIAVDSFDNLENLLILQLQFNQISLLEENIIPLGPQVALLNLESNLLENLRQDSFKKSNNISILNLTNNKIQWVHPKTFYNLPFLSDLYFSNNKLTRIPSGLFDGNPSLQTLQLAFNPIKEFPYGIFQNLQHLEQLDLRGVMVDDVTLSVFDTLPKLCFIEFKLFRYCLHVPSAKICSPKSDGISSFENLLNLHVLRASIWIVAVVTCFGNVLVFVGRILVREENHIHSMFIKNLCMSDFLMGVYLVSIAIQDTRTRGEYLFEAVTWQASWVCHISGVLAMISSEVSVLILTFMSIDRCIIISNPYTTKQLSPKRGIMCLCFIWMFGGLLAGIPFMSAAWFGDFYGSNGVCFPLHIHEPYEVGWQYSAFLFLGLNFVSVCIIGFCYGSMLRNILSTRQRSRSKDQNDDLAFARRFFLIVLTDAACWIPIFIVKILAFSTVTISDDAYAWFAVFVLPVNSAINPILYSLSSVSFRRRLALVLVENNRRISDISDTVRGSKTRSSSGAGSLTGRRLIGHSNLGSTDGELSRWTRVKTCVLGCLLQVTHDDSRISDPQCTMISPIPMQDRNIENTVLLNTHQNSNLYAVDDPRLNGIATSFSDCDIIIERLTSTPIKASKAQGKRLFDIQEMEEQSQQI